MRALQLKDSELTLRHDYPQVEVPDSWTRVRVIQAGICETDLQLLAGYMGFSGILGHEFVGVAETGPHAGHRVVGEINCVCEQCEMCDAGLGNHCPNRSVVGILNHNGAFADSLVIPNRNLHRVPDSMSDDLATLVEPVAAALQIPDQVDVEPGMKAVVVGDGRLGNLCAQVLKSHGCKTHVVGKHAAKLEVFDRLGDITTHLLPESHDLGGFDLAVDCTGSSSGLETALRLVRPRGTVIMKTTVADPHQLSLAAVVINEITLVGSRCGPFDKAIHAIGSGRINLDGFVTARFSLEEFETAFKRAQDKDALKVILTITDSTSVGPL
ncbi:MAG: alcohol dehydrogenase catalytic domain-containing protein [Planctomycetota bacterium]